MRLQFCIMHIRKKVQCFKRLEMTDLVTTNVMLFYLLCIYQFKKSQPLLGFEIETYGRGVTSDNFILIFFSENFQAASVMKRLSLTCHFFSTIKSLSNTFSLSHLLNLSRLFDEIPGDFPGKFLKNVKISII